MIVTHSVVFYSTKGSTSHFFYQLDTKISQLSLSCDIYIYIYIREFTQKHKLHNHSKNNLPMYNKNNQININK